MYRTRYLSKAITRSISTTGRFNRFVEMKYFPFESKRNLCFALLRDKQRCARLIYLINVCIWDVISIESMLHRTYLQTMVLCILKILIEVPLTTSWKRFNLYLFNAHTWSKLSIKYAPSSSLLNSNVYQGDLGKEKIATSIQVRITYT